MFKYKLAAAFSAVAQSRAFGIVAGFVLVFSLGSAATAQEKARPYKRSSPYEIEVVQAYADTPQHCRLKRSYGTEEWLMIVFGKNYLAFDFSGLGTAALGNQIEVNYSIVPIDPRPATAKLIPIGGHGGFEVLRVEEAMDGPGSLDDLLDEQRTRIVFRTKYPPADRSIPGRWSYDIKGIHRAVGLLIECRDNVLPAANVSQPKQQPTQQPAQRSVEQQYFQNHSQPPAPPQVTQNNPPAQTPPQRQVECLLVVKGKTYLDGRCGYESDADGSFRMFGKDYFVYLNVFEKNLADASWNADPRSTHAHTRIGEVRRDGGCWVLDQDTRICAWRVGERPSFAFDFTKIDPKRVAKAAPEKKRARYACPPPGSVKSINSKIKAVVHFANSTGRDLDFIWLDFDGNRKVYRTLKNGQDYKQQTFVSHAWLIVDKQGRCLNFVFWPQPGKQLNELFDDN